MEALKAEYNEMNEKRDEMMSEYQRLKAKHEHDRKRFINEVIFCLCFYNFYNIVYSKKKKSAIWRNLKHKFWQ